MKRKNKISIFKKVIKTLPVFVAVVAVFYLSVLIKDVEVPTLMPVKDVHVVGNMRFLDNNEVYSIIENNISGGYFTVDINDVRDALLELPWVKHVSLRRQWPAGLIVNIDERKPVAYWNKNGYIGETGEVFTPEIIDESLNLPKLNGPEGHHNNVWKFMNVLYQEMALLDFEVVSLNLDERRAWQLLITEGKTGKSSDEGSSDVINTINVRLGRFETDKRLQRFVRILPVLTAERGISKNEVTKNNIKVIDMRYPNGFAVQKKAVNITAVEAASNADSQTSEA